MICAERGCNHPAGGRWSPYFCRCCDFKRVLRITRTLRKLAR